MTIDWERDWPEAIDPETGEDPDGVVHPVWVNRPDRDDTGDWTDDPQ